MLDLIIVFNFFWDQNIEEMEENDKSSVPDNFLTGNFQTKSTIILCYTLHRLMC